MIHWVWLHLETERATLHIDKYSMDINELESFKLSDAVSFHEELNPKLWEDHTLDPAVRDQLLLIAEDFVEYLGLNNLKVKDVTVSGSNAAYSYTPHSDLDLHILVDFNELPDNEVYQELFTAKKTLYNDAHDITVRDVPVELYVQDINQPVQSLGEYSILHDKWIRIPKKRRANFDEAATKLKYEKLGDLIELALKSKDSKRVNDAIALVKRYRKSGLDKHGEFGPENLAYKAVRKQGLVQALYDLRDELHTEKLSIDEYANEDYDPNGPPPGPEFKPTMPAGTVKVDVSDVYDWYKLGQHISNMKGLGKHDFGKGPPSAILSFGDEDTEHEYIQDLEKTGLSTTDIDPVDKKQPKGMKRQKTDPTYNVNEAPRTFAPQVTPLEKLIQDYGYFISTGTVHLEKNGETPEAQQKLLALVQRLQKDAKTFVGLDKNKMEANRDTILNHIHQMMQYAIPILKQYLPADKWEAKREPINRLLTAYNNARQINEASGYIPSAKEKNDPRFKTALTVDVKPDAIKKNAKAFGFKTSRAGIPPQARADGKIAESLMNEWKAFLAEDETLTEKQFYPKQIRQQYTDPNKPWATGEYQNKDQRLGGTEQLPKPIHDYVGTSFGLNKSLVNRKSITGLVQNLVRRLKGGQSYSQPIKELDALLSKSLMPQDTIVYHGTHKFNPGELAAKGAGKITIPSYLSTSTDKNVAYHFSGARYGDGHIIEISLKKGQPAFNIGGLEGEVLLPRNTTLQIDPDPTELPGKSFLWHAQIIPKSVTEDPSAPTILD